jgi:dethiobiotin synthetase
MNGRQIIFVTGTDTGVGKTVLTALLLHHLRDTGIRALAMKPFCSGGRADVRLLQSLQPDALSDHEMNPFYFARPVAPFVAQKHGRAVRLREVVQKIGKLKERCDWLIVEGSGGLLVPLGPGFFVADLIAKLKCRVIIAARDRLGTINHTLLTVGALRAAGLKPRDLNVVLMSQRTRDASCSSNGLTLAELLDPVSVLKIPYLGGSISSRAAIVRSRSRVQKPLGKLAKLNGIT